MLGPVAILVHNASGWRKDTFTPEAADRFDRRTERVSAATFDTQFHVDAHAGALLIAEFTTRHRDRDADWGRVVTLTSGGPNGFPGEVSYGAAKAALENYTMSAAIELAPMGITANVVYPAVTDTGWVTDDVRRFVAESDDHVHVATPAKWPQVIALALHRRSLPRDGQRHPPTVRLEVGHGCDHESAAVGDERT